MYNDNFDIYEVLDDPIFDDDCFEDEFFPLEVEAINPPEEDSKELEDIEEYITSSI